jgi:hypothetical protein
LGRVSPVRADPVNFYFFVINAQKVRRAHLHIAPRCRTEKAYETCGFDGTLEALGRRNP